MDRDEKKKEKKVKTNPIDLHFGLNMPISYYLGATSDAILTLTVTNVRFII